jgi:hypothetical protein
VGREARQSTEALTFREDEPMPIKKPGAPGARSGRKEQDVTREPQVERHAPLPLARPLAQARRSGAGTTRAPHLRLERGGKARSGSSHPPYGRRATDRAASIWVDAALREEVLLALREEFDPQWGAIDVFAGNGEVVLIGAVRSFHAEQRAMEIAARCTGVRSVVSQMHLVLVVHEDTAEGVAHPMPINVREVAAFPEAPTAG